MITQRMFSTLTCAGFLLATASVQAQPVASPEATQLVRGEAREWVRLQTSGDAAERAPSGMEGEVADRVWQRYVDSFSYPIPERFERDRFVEGGGN